MENRQRIALQRPVLLIGGKIEIRERQPKDLESVRNLLEAAGLPFTGIECTRGWIAEEAGRIVAHIAIEETEDAVVLRSLVTAPAERRRGIAKRLMDQAEAQADGRFLLLRSKTVGPWVLRRGYKLASAEELPGSVRSTTEFQGAICSGFPIYIKRLA